ncbi:hypothetical protein RJ639_014096 [Escallonia herrerae]|uniref:Transposase (putative) gypsy type domain-containing protein n=1 Tax=Escallonia herrerae TaxID=1293975 RepID=A0AA89ARD0_9ASTE|nr:hypothetical protein RJ639_014096 [Escallonia herrerae]
MDPSKRWDSWCWCWCIAMDRACLCSSSSSASNFRWDRPILLLFDPWSLASFLVMQMNRISLEVALSEYKVDLLLAKVLQPLGVKLGTSIPQASTSFPRRDALGEIKDEAEDKFDEETWFSVDEKSNKMTKESIAELLEEFPLLPSFSARVPALQEPANYGTDLETSVYEGQKKSGYRVPMHPFAVSFFNHYRMAPGQLVPNRWRKLIGLIYLVLTSGVIKGGPQSNKGWHSRYFFIQLPSGKWEFPRKWNGFCKDYEKKGSLAPDATTKKLIDHIKRRGGLNIDEPLTDQEMRHVGLIPPAPTMHVPSTPVVKSRVVLGQKT